MILNNLLDVMVSSERIIIQRNITEQILYRGNKINTPFHLTSRDVLVFASFEDGNGSYIKVIVR